MPTAAPLFLYADSLLPKPPKTLLFAPATSSELLSPGSRWTEVKERLAWAQTCR